MGFGRYRFRRSFGNVKSQFRGATPKHYPIFSGILDQYPNALAAFSFKALSSAMVGQPVVRIRRDSDDAEEDFTETEITDGTLIAWVGAGNNGYVRWFWNQGSGGTLSAGTANQRKLVDNGVLVTEGGEPAMAGGSNGGYYIGGRLDLSGAFSMLYLANPNATSVLIGDTDNSPRIRALGTILEVLNSASGEVNFTGLDGSPTLHTYDGTRVLTGLYRDGSNDITATIAGETASDSPLSLSGDFSFLQMFARSTNTDVMTGKFQEFIAWNYDIR
jgi:hypothetical protein